MTTPHPYVPTGPVEAAPYLGYCPPEVRQEAFCAVLEILLVNSRHVDQCPRFKA